MAEDYNLEKWVWTEADFDAMGWHDCQIHALAFSPDTFELLFDIDYIFEWVKPKPGETCLNFLTAPATLVFENVYDVEFDIGSYMGGLEIEAINRADKGSPHNAAHVKRKTEWQWEIICQEGGINFRAVGYKQYIRAIPQLSANQKIGLVERGGYSFAKRKVTTF